ncbi:hypothetical protein GQX73_g4742 [Xylaria multiplex]|uniref:FAD-binding domain-containing protein n=1 Tax=Xylaria multiplex TaxID=323545 RepID=A0A7C8ITR6_9PEZI|nr:hypothetical protein GQX73_g4742 [Xylaria multiplex]
MTINKTLPEKHLVHDNPRPLKVAIVGAGIGGLCAAIALRRQGHQVELYEQSKSVTETGAAIHLAPNSNGILRRWGILAETFGGNNADGFVERMSTGEIIKDVDLTSLNKMWQHPWQLVHRVALHNKLKETATSKAEPGIPAVIRTASKAVHVDAEAGILTLEDGTSVVADAVIGADGVYSRTRNFVHGKQARLFSSGKAAFRFLLQKKTALEDPLTAPLLEKDNVLSMWHAEDRRVVVYPCNHNETLNFVFIHPDSESHATQSDGALSLLSEYMATESLLIRLKAWNKQGSIDQVLKVFRDFDPALKKLISKVDESELKVWQLLDMEQLPSWTRMRLALLGDAAHPFTPHQGQGAGQAMEDAAALGTVLPKGTYPADVPERLQLYERIRYKRAHMIQEYSRQAGRDWINGKPQIDMMAYTAYNFGHDEIDHASNVFKRWLWSKNPNPNWGMPVSFGPAPGPQPSYSKRTSVTASVEFKSSRTYLETLFPTDSFKFKSPATVCIASISATTYGNVSWLGGGGYKQCGLYIHGIEYTRKDGSSITGTYLAVLFEDLADSFVSSRDEFGMSKLYCELDAVHKPDSYRLTASWRGTKFLDFSLENLRAEDPGKDGNPSGDILTYRYIPAVDELSKADSEYACVVPRAEELKAVPPEVISTKSSTDATITLNAWDWKTLPTLHRIASGLAEIPIYGIYSDPISDRWHQPSS